MFTGLIKEVGKIKTVKNITEGIEIKIECNKLLDEINIDDSVALDGACQTVVSKGPGEISVQAVSTTLEKTTFLNFKPGYFVNMELALRASDRLGGHMVQGHINTTCKLKGIDKKGENFLLEFSIEDKDKKYVVQEGSITINGISLTISSLSEFSHSFTVSIIPHTYNNTNLFKLKIGEAVNIEFDIISKYVENMLKYGNNNKKTLNNDWLSAQGF